MTVLRAEDLSGPQARALFEEAIGPRPLAIVSTLGAYGVPHLFPVEWYSSACAYPPLQYFAVDPEEGEGRGAELLEQLRSCGDFVLNGVDERIARALPALARSRVPDESEFSRAGLIALPSLAVRSFRIKESPTQLECRVLDVFPTGNCSVVLGAVLAYHVRDDVYDNGKVDQARYAAVGRIGADAYCRTSDLYLMQPSLPMSAQGLPLHDDEEVPA